eukprot:gene14461-3541_t
MHPAAPFGGFKQSGIGRENGQSGLLAFLEAQTFNVAKNAKWTAKLQADDWLVGAESGG